MKLSQIHILIATYDNPIGLTRAIHSIIDKYPGAMISVGDSALQLDRKFYKELRAELGEAGMVTRLKVHHLPYKSTLGQAFNELNKRASGKYRLLLTDEDYFTDKTDLEAMIDVMESSKLIGVVSGKIHGVKTEADLGNTTEGGTKYGETKKISRFMLVRGDVRHYLRYDVKSDDPATEFSAQAPKRLPFKIMAVDSIIKSDKDYESEKKTKKSDGDSGGDETERDLSPQAGGSDTEDGSDDTSSSERQDETSEDKATDRRSRRGGAR